MSTAVLKLLRQRIQTEIEALETGKLRMRDTMAFVLRQQVKVNRLLDKLALAEPGSDEILRKRVSI